MNMRLTGRSVGLLAVAAGCLIVGLLVGIGALFTVTYFSVALVVTAAISVRFSSPKLRVSRSLSADTAVRDQVIDVELTADLSPRLPVLVTSWRDRVANALQVTSQLAEPAASAGPSHHYAIVCHGRGRHQIGPLTVTVGDAFGLVTREVESSEQTSVIVLPRTVELASLAGDRSLVGVGGQQRAVATSGPDDVVARPYQPGDPLRRWHWKATAHRAEPMVRQEEAEAAPSLRIVLDTEPRVYDRAHFEFNVSAAASLLTHFAQAGLEVELVCGGFGLFSTQDLSSALVALALVEPGPADLAPTHSNAPMLLLTGRPDVRRSEELANSLRSAGQILLADHTGNQAVEVLAGAGFEVFLASSDIAESLAQISAVRVQ